MEGMSLLRSIVEATGLPSEAVDREIQRLLQTRGLDPETLTMEDLREVLALYLQDVLLEAKSQY